VYAVPTQSNLLGLNERLKKDRDIRRVRRAQDRILDRLKGLDH
jgi:hypothetical protein